MSAMIKTIKKYMPTKRKIMQLYFALLFNANLKGFVSGNIYKGQSKQFCVPGINCYSCPGAIGACPLGSLQGSFSADKSTIYYVCGILLLVFNHPDEKYTLKVNAEKRCRVLLWIRILTIVPFAVITLYLFTHAQERVYL